ncbi:MAG: 2-phospho-L-lactate guanylyltransferase [Chloroflexi bacterium]|nr:2-phospho-L-lactate guanylyltransferase [Chloroflexota bacterium]
MTLWAIIPVKPLREGKSRLARVLDPDERERVNRWLLQNTLNIVGRTPGIDQVLVVSRDTAALALARSWGARVLQEAGDADLNGTLTRAAALLHGWHVPFMLVLAVDLPHLTQEDLEAVVQPLRAEPVPERGRLVIAPDRARQGTNALGLAPPAGYTFAYGPGSFGRHVRTAQAQNREVHIVYREGLARDLDWPHDITLLRQAFPGLARKVVFEQIHQSPSPWPG